MRKTTLFIMLVAAAVIPYAATNKDWYPKLKSQWNAIWSPPPGSPPDQSWLSRVGSATKAMFSGKPAAPMSGPLVPNAPVVPLVGQQVEDLKQIIRFDMTPDWIINHWGRVSTVFSEPGLEGLRVAVVSGIDTDDVAGSLTYYFDQKRVIQRITFRGTTGDSRKLVDLVQNVYSFKSDPSVVSEQYTARWSGKIGSVLRVTNPPVIRAGQPLSRLEFQLEINRPNSPFGLSREMQQTLTTDAAFAKH